MTRSKAVDINTLLGGIVEEIQKLDPTHRQHHARKSVPELVQLAQQNRTLIAAKLLEEIDI